MSGHSKWSTIKRKKGAADAKRSNAFTKIANAISIAAKNGKGLDIAIEQARKANMPKDKIDKAIARGKGGIGGQQMEEILYEAYGPGGAAVMIKVITDNKNRSLSEIRSALNKFGGTLAGSGAVSYLFEEKGVIEIPILKLNLPKDDVEMLIIDSNAEDFIEDEGYIKKLMEIKNTLEFKAIPVEAAKIEMIPKNYIELDDNKKDAVTKLLNALEDLDDVQEVFSNLTITDEAMTKLEGE